MRCPGNCESARDAGTPRGREIRAPCMPLGDVPVDPVGDDRTLGDPRGVIQAPGQPQEDAPAPAENLQETLGPLEDERSNTLASH